MNNVVLELSRGAYPFLKIHNLEVAKPGLIALPSSAAQSCSAEAAPFWGTKSPKEGEDFAICLVKQLNIHSHAYTHEKIRFSEKACISATAQCVP